VSLYPAVVQLAPYMASSRVSAASRRIMLVLARMLHGHPGTARIVIPCSQNYARTAETVAHLVSDHERIMLGSPVSGPVVVSLGGQCIDVFEGSGE
jgi:hypothetical protein